MYSIRLCGPEDLETVADMAVQFTEESYSHLPVDLDKVLETVSVFLESPKEERIVIGLEADQTLVGVLAGISQELPFSRSKLATEMMWYVLPEHRNRNALKLIPYFEFWAKKIGCAAVSLAWVQGEKANGLSKLYERKGYSLLEQAYVKKI